MRRRLAWGIAAAGAYVAVALAFGGRAPVRPLYDSFAPPEPYKWVNPPAEFAPGNQQPEPTRQDIDLTTEGSEAASIATPDGQAVIITKKGGFAAAVGETTVVIAIEPLDPAKVGSSPDGLRYDGNAYRFTASYPSSGTPATLTQAATIVLRAPTGGTRLLRFDAKRWNGVLGEPAGQSLQIFGETTNLGVFVAAATVHAKPFPSLPVSLGASAVAAGAGWYGAAVVRTRRRLARARRRPRPQQGQGRRPPPRRKRR